MGENLTKQYQGYAKYLPSLQMNYARFAAGTADDIKRENYTLPKGFKVSDLDFLKQSSNLWHCSYALYSAGQFTSSLIRNKDIVGQRKRSESVIIGDSGGYQLGTGALKQSQERAIMTEAKKHPENFAQYWRECGFAERVLSWMDSYTDYAMTLDMVLWSKLKKFEKSPLHKLSEQQLIDLSVENLKFFENNRNTYGTHTKFLNVLQGDGDDSEKRWYDAVKDFEFEGWAMVGNRNKMMPAIKRFRKLLDDYKLDKSEWVHILCKSPPINSVVYTTIQRTLRKLLNSDITISYDSSSPHQMAGKQRSFVLLPEFSKNIDDWQFGSHRLSDDYRHASGQLHSKIEFASPLTKYFDMEDMFAHADEQSDHFGDSFTEHLMVNHNIYTYHRAAIDSCDLVFKMKDGHSKVPDQMLEAVELIEEYLTTETPKSIEVKLADLVREIGAKDKEMSEQERARYLEEIE